MPPHIRPDAEVSCRVFRTLELIEANEGLDLTPVLEELGVKRHELKPPHRMTWFAWARLCNATLERLGPERFEMAAQRIIGDETFMGPLKALAGLVASPERLYHLVVTWFVPYHYTHIVAELDRQESHLLLTVRITDNGIDATGWMHLFIGGMRNLPNLLHYGTAQVDVLERAPSLLRLVIRPPAKRTVWATARRFATSGWSNTAILEEMENQRAALDASREARRATDQSFRNLLDALPVGVGLESDGWVYRNPALRRIMGDERRLSELFPDPLPDDLPHTPVQRALVSADGREHVVLASPLADVWFEDVKTSGVVVMDASARVHAEQELQETVTTLELLTQNTPDMLVRCDRNGILQDAVIGTAFEHLAAIRLFKGRPLRSIARAAPTTAYLEDVLTGFDDAVATNRRKRVLFHDEGPPSRTIEARILPLERDVLLLFRDTTALVRLQERAQEAERLATVGAMAGNLAHTLNNPLTYVLGNLSALLEDATLSLGVREVLEDALSGAERIQSVVQGLDRLDIVEPPVEKALDLEPLVRAQLAHRAPPPTVSLVAGRCPSVRLDQDVFARVLDHLLDVACPTALSKVVITLEAVDGMAVLHVDHDGPPIPAKHHHAAFDAFGHIPGIGSTTGLAVARQHLHSVQGTLTLHDGPLRGTRLTVTLPGFQAPTPEAHEGKPHILIVDDELRVAAMTDRILRRDFQTTVTNSSEEAWEVLKRQSPDIVLCDLWMPGMTGMDLYARVTELRPDLEEAFLFVTGDTVSSTATRFLRTTGSDVVQKPFRPADLRQSIWKSLRRRNGS